MAGELLWMLLTRLPVSVRASLSYFVAICGIFCTFSLPALASAIPTVQLSEFSVTDLANKAQLVRTDKEVSFEAVKNLPFELLTDHNVNQGISGQAYWLRFRVHNNLTEPATWIIHNDTSYLDNLVVYTRASGSSEFVAQHLTDRAPFHTRQVNYRYLAFSYETPAHGLTDVYVKAYFDKADSVSLNFRLWHANAFWQNSRNENLLFGGYYGVLLILSIISLTFAMLLRQKIALYYAAFLGSTGVLWLMLNGYGFQYLWPNGVYWHNEGFHMGFLLYALLGIQFTKAFLRTHISQPRTHKLLTTLQAIGIIALMLRAIGNYNVVLDLAFGLLLLLALVVPVVSWRAWRKGLRYARWFTMAWAVYSVTLALSVVSAYSDAVQWGMDALGYMQGGSLVEAVFLMAAMSEWLLSLESDRRKAVTLAHQDPLTGLGNRRLLQLRYESFVEQFPKRKQPVFLIMMDLDFFKQVNDTYGHDAGDHVLKHVASLLERLSREGDVCVRYGGEEFAILLRADSLDAVWQVAERVRLQFAEHPTEYNGLLIEHTLSSGITQVVSEEEVLSVSEMMIRADAALYRGKSAGRNCTTIYHAEGQTDDDSFLTPTPA